MTRRWAPTLWSARSGDGQGVGAFAYLAVFFCFFGRVGAAASSSPPLVAAAPSCVRTAWHSKNTYRERERERDNKHTHTHSLTLSLSLSHTHTRMARLTYIQRERARDNTHIHARTHASIREAVRWRAAQSPPACSIPGCQAAARASPQKHSKQRADLGLWLLSLLPLRHFARALPGNARLHPVLIRDVTENLRNADGLLGSGAASGCVRGGGGVFGAWSRPDAFTRRGACWPRHGPRARTYLS